MASKALRPLPVLHKDLSEESRVRQRYADLLRAEVVLNKRHKRDAAIHRAVAKQCDAATTRLVGAALASDAFFLESSISQPEEPWPLPMAIDASGDVLVACAALPTICLPPPGHEFSLMRFHPKAHGFDLSIVGLDIALREIAVVPVPEVGTGLLLAAGLTLMRSRKIAQPGGIKGT